MNSTKYIEAFFSREVQRSSFLIKFNDENVNIREQDDEVIIERFEVLADKDPHKIVKFRKADDGITYWSWTGIDWEALFNLNFGPYVFKKYCEKYKYCQTDEEAQLIFEVGE